MARLEADATMRRTWRESPDLPVRRLRLTFDGSLDVFEWEDQEGGLLLSAANRRENPPAAIILAAGASLRMGFPKPLLRLDGETFLDRLILACSSYCNPVIAVLGHHGDRIQTGIRLASQVHFVTNPDPDRGMLSSLKCALMEIPPNWPGALFTPVDYPRIQPATVGALVDAFQQHSAAPVIVPTHEGRRGHPVLVDRSLFEEFLALPPDGVASDVIRRHRSSTVWVPVDDPGILRDVDTPADFAAETEHKGPFGGPTGP